MREERELARPLKIINKCIYHATAKNFLILWNNVP